MKNGQYQAAISPHFKYEWLLSKGQKQLLARMFSGTDSSSRIMSTTNKAREVGGNRKLFYARDTSWEFEEGMKEPKIFTCYLNKGGIYYFGYP